jgi:hypothetical protein
MRIHAIKRQIASTPSVNKIRDFSSGILKQLVNVLAMERNMRQKLIQAIKRQIASKPRVNTIRDFSPEILKVLVMEQNMR